MKGHATLNFVLLYSDVLVSFKHPHLSGHTLQEYRAIFCKKKNYKTKQKNGHFAISEETTKMHFEAYFVIVSGMRVALAQSGIGDKQMNITVLN